MKVLLLGVGGVGEAIDIVAGGRPWLEKMIFGIYNLERTRSTQKRLDKSGKRKAFSVLKYLIQGLS